MKEFEVVWSNLASLDGFYSYTPGETPVIGLGQHLQEGSSDYWRVFLGLLGEHYSLSMAERMFPYMAFSPRLRPVAVFTA